MSKWPYNTASWQRLREAKLSANPICEVCIRREVVQVATVVDHIIAIAKGGEAFPPLSGLMSMCEPCHNIKTNAVDHPNATGFRRAYKGYDVDGNPIDGDGWDAPQGNVEALGTHREPGAFKGRSIDGLVPAAETRNHLVSILPNQEVF